MRSCQLKESGQTQQLIGYDKIVRVQEGTQSTGDTFLLSTQETGAEDYKFGGSLAYIGRFCFQKCLFKQRSNINKLVQHVLSLTLSSP